MSKVRNTTQEERVQIAKESLASGKNYGEIAQNTMLVTNRSEHGHYVTWNSGIRAGRSSWQV